MKAAKRWKLGIGLAVALAAGAGGWYAARYDVPILHGEVLYDLPFTEGQTLDVYLPLSPVFEQTPVVVYFHGGAWVTGTKETVNTSRYSPAVQALREAGYAVVTPNYTLATRGHSPFPDCIEDALAAMHWVQEHAGQYRFDLDNVGIWGESAGAHLAMAVAYGDAERMGVTGDEQPTLRYLVDVYGPNDLEALYRMRTITEVKATLAQLPPALAQSLDITELLFGFAPEQDAERARAIMRRYSPIHDVDADEPPTLLIHGDADQVVPFDQSLALQARLKTLGVEHEFHRLEGVNHGFAGATRDQRDDVQDWIVAFVKRHHTD